MPQAGSAGRANVHPPPIAHIHAHHWLILDEHFPVQPIPVEPSALVLDPQSRPSRPAPLWSEKGRFLAIREKTQMLMAAAALMRNLTFFHQAEMGHFCVPHPVLRRKENRLS